MTSAERRPRLTPYPRGWYFVDDSSHLARGDVRPIQCFGRDLVLFRTDDGEAHIVDAYCPHLGAHLGHGGAIVGDRIRCPFHGWEFEGKSGVCKKLASGDPVPPKARLNRWHVSEVAGLILLWFHDKGEPPDWEVPVPPGALEPGWSDWADRSWTFTAVIQDISENDADVAHSPVMHGFLDEPPALRMETNGQNCRWTMDAQVKLTAWGLPKVPGILDGHVPSKLPSQIVVDRYGISLGWVRQTMELPGGRKFRTQSLATTMPLDEGHVRVTIRHRVRNLPTRTLTRLFLHRYAHLFNLTVEEDVVIWSNKIYRLRPVASKSDWAILKFRKWARQFYDSDEYDAAYASEPVSAVRGNAAE